MLSSQAVHYEGAGVECTAYLTMLDFLQAHICERLIHQHLLVGLAEGLWEAQVCGECQGLPHTQSWHKVVLLHRRNLHAGRASH